MSESPRLDRRTVLILMLPLILYGAAINPYFLPQQYDNTLYYYGGEALAQSPGARA